MAIERAQSDGDEGRLPGMPPAMELRLEALGENVVVSHGGRALAMYERGDRGMRNLAIVSLTRAGVAGVEVARLFGIRPEHVSRLRRQADEDGAWGLLPVRGRPAKLDAAARGRAFAFSAAGMAGSEIARRLGVSAATVSRLLATRRIEPERLVVETFPSNAEPEPAEASVAVVSVQAAANGDSVTDRPAREADAAGELARLGEGGGRSAYCGAMLLHPFLEKVGAGRVLCALESGPARAYDTTAVALAGMLASALGCSSLEGSKHLQPAGAGLLIGVERFPHLRTLRPRLGMLADACDPFQVQAALAKGMLDADEDPPSVFFVDEHFVAYTGSRPVGKGWNTRRRHAEPGRHDTIVVDERWRAICFHTGPPRGLAEGMLDPLDQLLEISAGRPITVGFDRGGAYPKAFCALRDRGIDWVTYRRAPLAETTARPRTSWVQVDGTRRTIHVADERVEIDGYGECRQLTVYEHDQIVLQILTSDIGSTAARLAYTLRCRWRIENTFKYLEDHHGLHWLCDYTMDLAPDIALVRNPARSQALAHLRACERTASELEQKLGKHHTAPMNADTAKTTCMLTADLYQARHDITAAKQALKTIPAKLPANQVDPDAQRATPKINRRALQTVLRLLAYNAELDLARALNCYLNDSDEYRTIARHLLHQPGRIDYTTSQIVVTIDEPHAPRTARALNLLIEQINHTPPRLAGDHRPIHYQISSKP